MIKFSKNYPLYDIHMRMLSIQKKIFQATKAYNKILVYKLQNYLLNSIEVKIFAIEHIVEQSEFSSYIGPELQKRKKIFFSKNNYKYILLNSFLTSHTYVSGNLKLILEKVKQYIIYLCIYPEWQAKLDQNKNEIYDLIDKRLKKNITKISSNKKYQFKLILQLKIHYYKYIIQCYKYWNINNYFNPLIYENINNTYYIKLAISILNNPYLKYDKLFSLLNKIYINGSYWLKFYDKVINTSNGIKNINKVDDSLTLQYILKPKKRKCLIHVSLFKVIIHNIIYSSIVVKNIIKQIYKKFNFYIFYHLKKNNKHFSQVFIPRRIINDIIFYIYKIIYCKNYILALNR